MQSGPTFHHRKSIRLRGFDYSRAGGYFVTLVTHGRECLFGEIAGEEMHLNPLGKIVVECWEEIPLHFPKTAVDAFVVMPNHLHGIIFIHENNENNGRGTIYRAPTSHAPTIEQFGKPTAGSLPTIIRTFKAGVTRCANCALLPGKLWQRNYYEHILRDQTDYERIAHYIAINPRKWDLDEENPTLVRAHHAVPQPLNPP